MVHRTGRLSAGVVVLVFCVAWASPVAHADLMVIPSKSGAPTGVSYVNFDTPLTLPLGNAGGTSGGIGVSFTGTGQAVQGTTSEYAEPYVNGNGGPFGNPNGPDTSTYLSTGIGSVKLTLPGSEQYIGLLWGSVDTYNTLSLYNASGLVGTVTGSQVIASPDGDQGVNGTVYVNINSSVPFTYVVASSSSYAFEFDNVAFNPTPASIVPEPSTSLVAIVGALGIITYNRLRRKGLGIAS
jgi:hypothetical protein